MSVAKLKGKKDRGQLGGNKSSVLKMKENESAVISVIADKNMEIIDTFPHHKVASADNTKNYPNRTLTCWEGFGLKCPMCQMEKVVKHKQFPTSQSRGVIQFINFDSNKDSSEKTVSIQRFVAWEGYFAPFIDTYENELIEYMDEHIDEKIQEDVNSILKNYDLETLKQHKKLVDVVGEDNALKLINPLDKLTYRFKMSGTLPNATYTFSKMKEKNIDNILEAKADDVILLHDFWKKNSLSELEEITGLDFGDYLDSKEFESFDEEEADAYE